MFGIYFAGVLLASCICALVLDINLGEVLCHRLVSSNITSVPFFFLSGVYIVCMLHLFVTQPSIFCSVSGVLFALQSFSPSLSVLDVFIGVSSSSDYFLGHFQSTNEVIKGICHFW